MSCADPGPAALQLFTQLSTGPHPAAELDTDAVALLAKWGWVFVRAGKVELTGTGRASKARGDCWRSNVRAMAMISCPECEHVVSEHARECPSCGFPLADAIEAANTAARNHRRLTPPDLAFAIDPSEWEGSVKRHGCWHTDGKPPVLKYTGLVPVLWYAALTFVCPYCYSRPVAELSSRDFVAGDFVFNVKRDLSIAGLGPLFLRWWNCEPGVELPWVKQDDIEEVLARSTAEPPDVLTMLRSASAEVRDQGIQRVAALAPDELTFELAHMLIALTNDPARNVRARASWAIGKHRSKSPWL